MPQKIFGLDPDPHVLDPLNAQPLSFSPTADVPRIACTGIDTPIGMELIGEALCDAIAAPRLVCSGLGEREGMASAELAFRIGGDRADIRPGNTTL